MSDNTFDVIITSNSPGELYSLVRPAIKAIKTKIRNSRIILVITPCQYASGREIEVARTFPELYEIIFPQEFKKWAIQNKQPKGIKFSNKGVVLFMGGDLLHAVVLSKKLKYPAYAYTMNKIAWNNMYSAFFVPDEKMADKARKLKVPEEKIFVVGDLMVDAVSLDGQQKDKKNFTITLMPGSRPAHLRFLAPFFLKVADLIKEERPDIDLVFGLSPYSNPLKLEEYLSSNKMKNEDKKDGTHGRLEMTDGNKYIVSAKGAKVLIIEKNPSEAIRAADLMITIPGTNTAEAAAMGCPMLVVVPFNKPEAYIFDGLAGMIGNLPLIGRHIKKATIKVLNKANKYIALPNRKADRMVVPELRGNLRAEDVANMAIEMIKDPVRLASMSKELKDVMGHGGAADKIAEQIAALP